MDKSHLHLEYETGDEFNPELDFAQFLKEAKTHACRKSVASSSSSSSSLSLHATEEPRKVKRSWKASILSWMKTKKKEEQQPTTKTAYRRSTTRQGYVSGPINGVKGCNSSTERPKRSGSGPLSGLFNQKKKMEEFQMPYLSLAKLNSPQNNLANYGPVYLVT